VTNQENDESFGEKFEKIIETGFTKLGIFCAENPWKVLFIGEFHIVIKVLM